MAAVLERVAEFESELAELKAKRDSEDAQVLRKLLELLRGFSGNDEAFRSLLRNSQEALRITDDDLSQHLRVNRSTISRWTRGVTAPHAVMQESSLKIIARLVEGRLRQLKSL